MRNGKLAVIRGLWLNRRRSLCEPIGRGNRDPEQRRGDQSQEHDQPQCVGKVRIPPDSRDECDTHRQHRRGGRVCEPELNERSHVDLAFGQFGFLREASNARSSSSSRRLSRLFSTRCTSKGVNDPPESFSANCESCWPANCVRGRTAEKRCTRCERSRRTSPFFSSLCTSFCTVATSASVHAG